MKKFKYLKVENLSNKDLNELGNEGWELVSTFTHDIELRKWADSITTNKLKITYIFKREING